MTQIIHLFFQGTPYRMYIMSLIGLLEIRIKEIDFC